MDHFDLTKKFIGEKNAKLAMIFKVNQREEMRQKQAEKLDGEQGNVQEDKAPSDDENLLTIDESMHEDGGGGESTPVDEMFLVNHTKN